MELIHSSEAKQANKAHLGAGHLRLIDTDKLYEQAGSLPPGLLKTSSVLSSVCWAHWMLKLAMNMPASEGTIEAAVLRALSLAGSGMTYAIYISADDWKKLEENSSRIPAKFGAAIKEIRSACNSAFVQEEPAVWYVQEPGKEPAIMSMEDLEEAKLQYAMLSTKLVEVVPKVNVVGRTSQNLNISDSLCIRSFEGRRLKSAIVYSVEHEHPGRFSLVKSLWFES